MNLAIVNARMHSTRFPGKLMQELWGGKPVLEMFLERMKTVESWDHLILSIQKHPDNEPLKQIAEKLKVEVHESSLPLLQSGAEDVLGRTKEAADNYHANTIIRVTSDNPALHRDIIHRACMNYYMNRNGCNYVSNCWHGADGKRFPRGMEVEVFSYGALLQADEETKPNGKMPSEYDREHVTPFIRRFPRLFGHADIPPGQSVSGNNAQGLQKLFEAFPVRLTLDYPEDLTILRGVFEALQGKRKAEEGFFSLIDIAELYSAKPELFAANKHIEQRG